MSFEPFHYKGLFVDKYTTPAMGRIFSDAYYIQKLLDVEAALARAQATLGLIPQHAADEISACAQVDSIDMEALHHATAQTHHPFIPLLKVFTAACGESGRYVHWGATTQDILDTATVLQLKDAFEVIFAKVARLNQALAERARRHQRTIMMGRTNGQQALPITLGFKFAVWTAETQRHLERLLECQKRLLVGQFSGAVGNLASFGEHGLALRRQVLGSLGLKESAITWNTSRDSFVELASIIGIMASTLGKIGLEVYALQKQELGELEEQVAPHTAGSSTMPHKKNPFAAQEVTSIFRMLKSVVGEAFESLETEHERDPRSLNIENDYLPRLFALSDYALAQTQELVDRLGVDERRMQTNLELLGGVVFSEAVMMRIGEHVGKAEAHEIVFEASMAALEQHRPFKDALLDHSQVAGLLEAEEIDALLAPANYLGATEQLIDAVIDDNQALWQRSELAHYLAR